MLEEFSVCVRWLDVAAIDFLICLLLQLHTPCVFMGSRRACSPCWADSDLLVPFCSPSGSVPARYHPRVSSCPRKQDILGSVEENLEASSVPVTDASLKYLWLVSIFGGLGFHPCFAACPLISEAGWAGNMAQRGSSQEMVIWKNFNGRIASAMAPIPLSFWR